jgi:hypothetical protein
MTLHMLMPHKIVTNLMKVGFFRFSYFVYKFIHIQKQSNNKILNALAPLQKA